MWVPGQEERKIGGVTCKMKFGLKPALCQLRLARPGRPKGSGPVRQPGLQCQLQPLTSWRPWASYLAPVPQFPHLLKWVIVRVQWVSVCKVTRVGPLVFSKWLLFSRDQQCPTWGTKGGPAILGAAEGGL